MSNKSSNGDEALLGFIKRIPGQISSIIAFLTLIAGTILSLTKWFGGNTNSAIYVGLIFLLLVCWEIALYILFRKTSTHTYSAVKSKQTHKKYLFAKRTRFLTLASITIITSAYIICAYYWQRIPDRPNAKTIILVADFQSLDGQNYGVTEKIIEDLHDALRSFPGIEVQALKQTIVAQDGSAFARSIAKERNATILLWGFYRRMQENVWITTHVEVLQKPHDLRLKRDDEQLILPVRGIESFQIQTQLSHEVTYLILLTLGLAHYEVDDNTTAIDLFTRALSQEAVPAQMVDPADVYFFRGNAYLGLSAYDNAIADYVKALQVSPESSCSLCAYSNLGIAYIFRMKYDEAISSLTRALKYSRASDDNSRIHYDLGLAYEGKTDYDHAIFEYTESINQEPTAGAYFRLGVRFHMKGEFNKALGDLNQALTLNPGYGPAYNQRGILFSITGDYEKAVADFTQALKFSLAADLATIYSNRANAFMDKGDYDSALADFNTSLQINPKFSGAFYGRGYLFLNQKQYTAALEDFNKALSLENEYTEVYHHRGIAFQMLGQKEKALADYRKFLELASNQDDSSPKYAHDNSRVDVIKRLNSLTH